MKRPIGIVSRDDIEPAVHGAAVKICETARALSLLDYDVYLIGTNPAFYYLFQDGIQVKLYFPKTMHLIPDPPDSLCHFVLNHIGIPAEEHFLYRSAIPVSIKARVFWAATKYKWKLIQAEFPPFVFAALPAAKLLRIPLIFAEHNVEFERIKETSNENYNFRNLKLIEQLACKVSDKIVTCSPVDKAMLTLAGASQAKLEIIPHGVSIERYNDLADKRAEIKKEMRAMFGVGENAPLLVFLGWLDYEPNYAALHFLRDEIMPELVKEYPSARCLCIGGMRSKKFDGGDYMIIAGEHDNPAPLLISSDIGVVPLISGGGTRLKILDYFAAGLAVVSTEKGAEGIECQNGRDIEIVSSPKEMATAISNLLKNHEHMKEIAVNGRKFVEQFSWHEIALRYDALYKEFL